MVQNKWAETALGGKATNRGEQVSSEFVNLAKHHPGYTVKKHTVGTPIER